MASFGGQSRPTLLATALALMAALFTFSACFATWGSGSPRGAPQLRTPALREGAGPRRAWDAGTDAGSPASGSYSLFFVAAAVTAFSAKVLLRTSVQRRAIGGFRESMERARPAMEGKTRDYVRNFIPGQMGYRECHVDERLSEKEPPRMCLSRVNEAMAVYRSQDFVGAAPAPLAPGDVKEVGSYMTKAASPEERTTPAQVRSYVKPRVGYRMEKERGEKRPPVEDPEYMQYTDKRFHLIEAAKQANAPVDKDIVCDRSTLMLLLEFLTESMTPELMARGQHENAVDLARVTKSGKGIVLERLFEKKNLWAEFRPAHGGWKRSEMSQRGSYTPAWERLATGDRKTTNFMVTGLKQVCGTSAGELDSCYRFVEFDMGGLSFLTKVRAHAKHEGKNVELAHKCFYYQDQVTSLKTYWQMVLGGTDVYVLGLHRSGKLVQVVEATTETILEKSPGLVEAAERRLGWLVELLKKVRDVMSKAGDDAPMVLQWQQGELVLGKYERVMPQEGDEEAKKVKKPVNILGWSPEVEVTSTYPGKVPDNSAELKLIFDYKFRMGINQGGRKRKGDF